MMHRVQREPNLIIGVWLKLVHGYSIQVRADKLLSFSSISTAEMYIHIPLHRD